MKPVNAMLSREITLVNRPPYKNFKRISARLIGREPGMLITSAGKFRLRDWRIETVSPARS